MDQGKSTRGVANRSVGAGGYLSIYLQKELKPTEIAHLGQNPSKLSSKIPLIAGARVNAS